MLSDEASQASAISLVSNVVLSCVKVLVGLVGASYAMIADGIESLGDCVSSLIVWGGLQIGAKEPDAEHPYGHGKAEAIATLFAGIGLWASAAMIAYQAIHEIMINHEAPRLFTVPALIAIIATKELLFRYLRGQALKHDSTALMAEAFHHRSDLLTSLCVLAGICIAVFAGPGFARADDVAALLVTGLIFRNGWIIIQPSIDELMDRSLSGKRYSMIRQSISETPGVIAVETLWIRRSGRRFHVDVHIEVDPEISVREGHKIAHRVKDCLIKLDGLSIEHVNTHVEPARNTVPIMTVSQ